MVAAAILGAGVLGAGASIYGASAAADAQSAAADKSIAAQQGQYNQTRNDLMPYQQTGQQANNMLMQQLPGLTAPITMDQATLEATPGYHFNLTQGLKSVQNSAAARGLGSSGAALKGAANYATGLADNTYLNQFNMRNTNNTNTYNRLFNVAAMGQNAAAQTGTLGQNTANATSSALMNAGNAQAAAYNSMGSTVNNTANNMAGLYMANSLYGGGSAGFNGAAGSPYSYGAGGYTGFGPFM